LEVYFRKYLKKRVDNKKKLSYKIFSKSVTGLSTNTCDVIVVRNFIKLEAGTLDT